MVSRTLAPIQRLLAMKPLRLLLIGLAAFALLLVVIVALAFNPGVQTWAARKLAPSTPELTVGIGQVDAGLHQTRVENIRVVQPGLVLTIPSAEIEAGVLDAAGGKIEVKRLVAKGWILDLTVPPAPAPVSPGVGPSNPPASGSPSASRPSPEATAREAFNGLFTLLELPFDLAVDGVDLAGEIILPEGRAPVTITGGGIAAGKDGTFALGADFKGTDASALVVRGTLAARMNTPRTFDRLEITVAASASGPQVPQGAKIDIALTATREAEGEAYVAALRSGTRDVLGLDVKLPPGTAPLAGSWKLDAIAADLAPFALGRPLPEFVAKGQGTFESDRRFSRIKAAGTVDASVDKLTVLQPEFAAFGRLALTAGFDVATQGDLLRLNKLDARVTSADPVASVTALQAIEFNPATGALTAANPAAELLRITLDGIPLAWARPFLGDLVLTGDDVRGAFTASARDGGFALRPAAPITLTNLSATKAGEPLVRAVDVSLSAQADYTPKGWTAEVTDLSALSAGAPLLKLTARAAQPSGEQQPLTASGVFEANLPSLLEQPVAARTVALKRGIARGNFSIATSSTRQIGLTVQLVDLMAANSRSLPGVSLQARADIDASGRIDAKAPVVITQAGRRSDLNLDAVITPAGKETNIKAQLTGDTLHVPDLMLLSMLSPDSSDPVDPEAPESSPPEPEQSPGKPAPGSGPTEPLWAGLTGELKFAFKTLVYSKEVQATDVGGVITIEPAALTMKNIGAALKTGGSLKAGGDLKFEAKKRQPYALKADVALNDVDPAPILRALSPGEPSPVEGRFDLTTQLSGRAVDPAKFTDNVIGDIHLTSKGGTFKALNVKARSVVGGAGTAATIAGAVGIFTGSEKTVKYAEMGRAAAEVIKQLGSIKFDQLNLVVGRDKKKNLDIKDLTLIAPIVHLTGSGQITHVPGVSVMRQPLLVNLQLGARDKLAANLRTLNLIEGQEDKKGYAAMTDGLRLDGSLQAIGTKQIENLIYDAITK
ncbi:MAG: hypothetical protein K0R17_237 [Rariglobus sp.]|jgi:hypothetical protein|nr:hypothetical protein [Rariglobus sp.]